MSRGSRPETRQSRWPPVPEGPLRPPRLPRRRAAAPATPPDAKKNPRRMESHAESHEGRLTCAALP